MFGIEIIAKLSMKEAILQPLHTFGYGKYNIAFFLP